MNWIIILGLGSILARIILKSRKNSYEKPIPEDIILLKKNQYKEEEFFEILELVKVVNKTVFRVENDQLIRSMLIIANGNVDKFKEIIDGNYMGDERDVIIEAMGFSGNTNDHGITPFEN